MKKYLAKGMKGMLKAAGYGPKSNQEELKKDTAGEESKV